MLGTVFASELVNIPNKSLDKAFYDELQKNMRFTWDLDPFWIKVVTAVFFFLFIFGFISIVKTRNKEFLEIEERYTARTKRKFDKIKNLAIVSLSFTLFFVYFFPIAFHLLRPGMENKVIGLVFVFISVLLFIVVCFFGFDIVYIVSLWESSFFIKLVLQITSLCLFYSLFLLCSILYDMGYIFAIENVLSNEVKTEPLVEPKKVGV